MVINLKGQVSLEFLSYFIIMLIALSFLTGSILDRQQNFNDFKENVVAQQIAVSFSSEIHNSLYYENYVAEFETVSNVFGQQYNISLSEDEVMVEWPDNRYRYSLRYQLDIDEETKIQSSQLPVKIKSQEEGGFEIDQ